MQYSVYCNVDFSPTIMSALHCFWALNHAPPYKRSDHRETIRAANVSASNHQSMPELCNLHLNWPFRKRPGYAICCVCISADTIATRLPSLCTVDLQGGQTPTADERIYIRALHKVGFFNLKDYSPKICWDDSPSKIPDMERKHLEFECRCLCTFKDVKINFFESAETHFHVANKIIFTRQCSAFDSRIFRSSKNLTLCCVSTLCPREAWTLDLMIIM